MFSDNRFFIFGKEGDMLYICDKQALTLTPGVQY